MEKRYDEVMNYLSVGQYPNGYSKTQKLSLRRYSEKFTLNEGQLFLGRKIVIQSSQEARSLFDQFHLSSLGKHLGIVKSRAALNSRFYWPGMSIDVEKWVSECDKCHRTGKSLTVIQPLQSIKVSAVWELVGVDLMGPFPKTEDGFEYILTATDYFSKWVEAFPLKTKTASEVAQRICSLIYRHGCPQRILSKQGKEFVDELNSNLCALLGNEKSVTAAYYPQTNGLDKITNGNIKRALTKMVNERQNYWDVFLDAALFPLRSEVHTTTKHSPFLLMYGREAVFHAEPPIEMPFSSIVFPEESTYCSFLEKKKQLMKTGKKATTKNISKAQEKQIIAYEKRILKMHKSMLCDAGQEFHPELMSLPVLDQHCAPLDHSEIIPESAAVVPTDSSSLTPI